MESLLDKVIVDKLMYLTTTFCVLCVISRIVLGYLFNKAVLEAHIKPNLSHNWSSNLQWSSLVFVSPNTDVASASKLTKFREANRRNIIWNIYSDIFGIASLMFTLLLLMFTTTSIVAEIVTLGLAGVVFPFGGAYFVKLYRASKNIKH